MVRHFRFASFLNLAALPFGAISFCTLPVQAQKTPASVNNAQLVAQASEGRASAQRRSRSANR